MKRIALATAFAFAATAVSAGSMADPIVEPVVIVEEAASSSGAGLIVPLLLLAIIAAAVAD